MDSQNTQTLMAEKEDRSRVALLVAVGTAR